MALQYQLKEGNYHLYDMSSPIGKATGERRLRLKTDTVAIAFDARTGILHEHGSPTRIHSWATGARRRLRAGSLLFRQQPLARMGESFRSGELLPDLHRRDYGRRAHAGQ